MAIGTHRRADLAANGAIVVVLHVDRLARFVAVAEGWADAGMDGREQQEQAH